MSKSWTPEELAAASAAMKAEGHMSYEEFCAAPVLRLEYRGRDSWDRPVYECDGRLYVDVDPRRSRPADICTKQGNAFDGVDVTGYVATDGSQNHCFDGYLLYDCGLAVPQSFAQLTIGGASA